MRDIEAYLIGWMDAIALNEEKPSINIPDKVERMLMRRGWMKPMSKREGRGARTVMLTPSGTSTAGEFVRKHHCYSDA